MQGYYHSPIPKKVKVKYLTYEDIVKTVQLTSDEQDLLIILLESKMDNCALFGEEITVSGLIEKLK